MKDELLKKSLALIFIAIISMVVIILLFFTSSKDLDSQGENSKMAVSAKDPLSIKDLPKETTTSENHTYIVIEGSSSETVILVLNHFEVTHPELIITRWQPVFINGKIQGVAIDHQPRGNEQISN